MSEILRKIYREMTIKKYSPTTDKDLLKAIDTNIVEHRNLYKYSNIDQILKNDACIIFYDRTSGNVGHWCCIIRRGDSIEYFDSYGRPPSFPKYIHGDKPYLLNLLKKSRYYVYYNPYNFQSKGVATCGRHVVMRILFKRYSLGYYKRFMNNIDHDDLVSFFTLPI
jgi:hypothetical protein